MPLHFPSPLHHRYLRRFYARAANHHLAARLGLSVKQVENYAARYSLRKTPGAGRFTAGHAPWNAGRLGFAPPGSEATRFAKGRLSRRANPLGDGAITVRDLPRGGYLYVRLAAGQWVLLHRLAWEQQYGPLVHGQVLRCRTTDTLNPNPENWQVLDRAAHGRLNGIGQGETPAVRLTDNAVAAALTRGNQALRQLLRATPDLLALKRHQLLLQRALRTPTHAH